MFVKKSVHTAFFAFCCFLCLASHSQAQTFEELKLKNWHQWRGPDATGVSKTAKPPIDWSEEKHIQWKVTLDGNGSSTPIIWGNKTFLLTAINTGKVDPSLPKPEDQPKRVFGITHPNTTYQFVVLCLDRGTGKELWRRIATERIPHEGHHGDNNFASASPTASEEASYFACSSRLRRASSSFCSTMCALRRWFADFSSFDSSASATISLS